MGNKFHKNLTGTDLHIPKEHFHEITGLSGGAWSVLYSDNDSIVTGLALGTSGLVLSSSGPSNAPVWASGGGVDPDLSGDFVTTSGDYVITSGDYALLSGDYAAGGLGDDLGDHEATQMLDMNTYKITGLGDPVADQDAATKIWTNDNYAPSGEYVTFSGDYVTTSGDYASTSGDISDYAVFSGDYSTHQETSTSHHDPTGYETISGDYLVTSGDYVTTSGDYVIVSGASAPIISEWSAVSGAAAAEADWLTVSGDFSDVSGDYVITSGDYAATSGVIADYATVSGDYSTHQGSSISHHDPSGYETVSGDYLITSGDYVTTSGAYAASSGDLADYKVLSGDFSEVSGDWSVHPSDGGGASNMTGLSGGIWSVFYSDDTEVVTGLRFGSSGFVLQSSGPNSAPDWQAKVAGGGDNLGNHVATERLNMSSKQITGLADPTDVQHAVTVAYANTNYSPVGVSGDFVTLSGDYSASSGDVADYKVVSGDFSALSGNYLTTSGDYVTTSGDYVITSGIHVDLSGDYSTHQEDIYSHHIITAINDTPADNETTTGASSNWAYDHDVLYSALSGEFINVSGDYSTTSGDYVITSGDYVVVSGDWASWGLDLTGLSGYSWQMTYVSGNNEVTGIGLGTSGLILSSMGPTTPPIWTSKAPGGGDADAIHDNVSDEINQITEEASPASTDVLIIESDGNSWAKRKVQITNLPGGADPDAIHDNVAQEIQAVATKSTLVDADVLLIEDSENSWNKKSVAMQDILRFSKTYYVSTDTELDAAISDIETNNYDARIVITADLTNVQATLNDASASYLIEGISPDITLDVNGDNAIFTITNCKKCIIRDLTINCDDWVSETSQIAISVAATANRVVLDNITAVQNSTYGTVFDIDADDCVITNCYSDGFNDVMIISSDSCLVNSNNFLNFAAGGHAIELTSTANLNVISGNICDATDGVGVYISGDNNIIMGNDFSTCGTGVICIGSHNIITGNDCYNCRSIGIDVSTGSYNLISENNCTYISGDSGADPMCINVTSNNNSVVNNICGDISGNDDTYNYYGIRISGDNCLVEGNLVQNITNAGLAGALGIRTEAGADATKIVSNYISGNDLDFLDSGTNTITEITTDAGEINGLTDKASPVGADIILIEDSAASYAKKKVSISTLPTELSNDASPQLGASLDLNDFGFTAELVAAESLVNGDLCYIDGSGEMAKADASTEATCDTKLAMCLDTISASSTGTFLLFGKYTTSSLTAGAEYFVSETAAAITTTRPTASTAIVRHVGSAISTTVLWFDPSHTYTENI